MRFITSLIFTACMSGEFLTPLFPDYFVLLASIANIGRAVGLTAFVATQPAFQQALCTGGNLADLTSKSQVGSGGCCCCWGEGGSARCRGLFAVARPTR